MQLINAPATQHEDVPPAEGHQHQGDVTQQTDTVAIRYIQEKHCDFQYRTVKLPEGTCFKCDIKHSI